MVVNELTYGREGCERHGKNSHRDAKGTQNEHNKDPENTPKAEMYLNEMVSAAATGHIHMDGITSPPNNSPLQRCTPTNSAHQDPVFIFSCCTCTPRYYVLELLHMKDKGFVLNLLCICCSVCTPVYADGVCKCGGLHLCKRVCSLQRTGATFPSPQAHLCNHQGCGPNQQCW